MEEKNKRILKEKISGKALSAPFLTSLPLPRQLWPEKRKKEKKRRRRKRAESISKGPPFPNKKGEVLLRLLRRPGPLPYMRKRVPFSHILKIFLLRRSVRPLQRGGQLNYREEEKKILDSILGKQVGYDTTWKTHWLNKRIKNIHQIYMAKTK